MLDQKQGILNSVGKIGYIVLLPVKATMESVGPLDVIIFLPMKLVKTRARTARRKRPWLNRWTAERLKKRSDRRRVFLTTDSEST